METPPRKMKKKIKPKSASSTKHECISMGDNEVENIVGNKGIENAHEEAPLNRRKLKEMNDEKKMNKRMGDAGKVDLENNCATGVSDGDDNKDAMGNAAGKMKKKKKNREKNKSHDTAVELGSAKEVEVNEGLQAMENHNHDDDEKGAGNGDRDGVGPSTVNCEVNVFKRKKRKRERKKNKDYDDIGSQNTCTELIMVSKLDNDTMANRKTYIENEIKKMFGTLLECQNDNSGEKIENKKKKKKKKKKVTRNENDGSDVSVQQQENMPENDEGFVQSTMIDNSEIKLDKKKRKKNKENFEDDSSVTWQDIDIQHSVDERFDNEEDAGKQQKKKAKFVVEDDLNDPTPNRSDKIVRFSGEVDVFPLSNDPNTENEENMVRGKRFAEEEDEIVKEAVREYIAEHDLGEEGSSMVLNCKKHPQLRGCWKEIGAAVPYRPCRSIYDRAQVLFRRSEDRKWTLEEYELVRKYQEQDGNLWRPLADELGKHYRHVNGAWQRIKSPNLKKGRWSQKEYQKLFDLVNADLQLKVFEEKRSKHGMLRDNISWTAISDRLSTRTQPNCCLKWYKQLTSPMVSQGLWADTDDYRLLGALYNLDATCLEDVDWNNLVEDRAGDLCRKRWSQMVLHIGHHGNKSFAEQVEILSQRYCPNLIEAREAWDSKPRVP